jgi:hypothetical protein
MPPTLGLCSEREVKSIDCVGGSLKLRFLTYMFFLVFGRAYLSLINISYCVDLEEFIIV